ncbi:uncharacterized protein K02A2.6-like [Octopus sinensis]|uniref:Uncharacterized protein K02A2.6-like n=1 Tax=Octopus sinensis TaxID=2607531 RepID=A0A6P7T287_9MOLL|nr:uncharacterized protein K02A2.6-like [Octopus sinensis]
MDKQIERLVKQCRGCAMAANAPPVQIQPWPKMDSVWCRLQVDFAGLINGSHYIIVVDSYSKWPEVCKCSRPTTNVIIEFLEELFTRYGVPNTIKSDNGTQFTVKEFERFCKLVQMKHRLTPPYHPRSNSTIPSKERFVDTFKRTLKKTRWEALEDRNMTKFLQVYRITPNPNAELGRSPTDLMFSRRIRSVFNKLLPSRKWKIQNSGSRTKFFNTDDEVYFKIYKNRKQHWVQCNITGRLNNIMHKVKGPKYEHKRHFNQLQERYTKNQGRIQASYKESAKALLFSSKFDVAWNG